MKRGIRCNGTIEFGRQVKLADGRAERTRKTLKILYDPGLERLSNFIVHRHRSDLSVHPEWLVHPNGALGIHQVTIMAGNGDWPQVQRSPGQPLHRRLSHTEIWLSSLRAFSGL
jgi:hypothetical protein